MESLTGPSRFPFDRTIPQWRFDGESLRYDLVLVRRGCADQKAIHSTGSFDDVDRSYRLCVGASGHRVAAGVCDPPLADPNCKTLIENMRAEQAKVRKAAVFWHETNKIEIFQNGRLKTKGVALSPSGLEISPKRIWVGQACRRSAPGRLILFRRGRHSQHFTRGSRPFRPATLPVGGLRLWASGAAPQGRR